MFDNIGEKIKGVATTITWIGIFLSLLSGIAVMFLDEIMVLVGFVIIIVGSLCSWLSSITLYGFGQLIENSDILVAKATEKEQKQSDAFIATEKTSVTPDEHKWQCNSCGKIISEEVCPFCNSNQKIVPVALGNGKFECPVCGCAVKKGQEKCLCFNQLDWSSIQ